MLNSDTRECTDNSAQCPVKDVFDSGPDIVRESRDIVHGDCINACAISDQTDCADENGNTMTFTRLSLS